MTARRWMWRLLVPALLVWSYFARPVYDFAWVAAGRVNDIVTAKIGTPLARQDRQAAIDRALAQGDEIADYLKAQRGEGDAARAGLESSDLQSHARSLEVARARLRTDLGYPPKGLDQTAPGPVKETPLGEDEFASYRELQIPVLPGVHSTGIYMRPKSAPPSARLPLIIAANGRGGMPDPTPDGKLPIAFQSNRDMAWNALKHGYAVWVPTYVHYGKDSDDLRDRLTVRAWEAGTSLPAIEIAKTVKAIDALVQRPDVDPERIGMVGMSYGGFYTLYTTALEPRIKAAVVAAYFNDREGVLDRSEPHGFLDWRFPNSLTLWRDPEVAALIAPRPLLIESGNQDQLFPIEGARRAAPRAQQYYERLGAGDRFRFMEFVGRHDFAGGEAMDFMDKQLAGPADAK